MSRRKKRKTTGWRDWQDVVFMGKRGVLACQGWSRGAGLSSVILIIRKVTESSGVAGGGAQGPVTPAGAALCGDYKWEGPESLLGCCQGRRACPRSSRDLRPETQPGRSSAGRLCCVWRGPSEPHIQSFPRGSGRRRLRHGAAQGKAGAAASRPRLRGGQPVWGRRPCEPSGAGSPPAPGDRGW